MTKQRFRFLSLQLWLSAPALLTIPSILIISSCASTANPNSHQDLIFDANQFNWNNQIINQATVSALVTPQWIINNQALIFKNQPEIIVNHPSQVQTIKSALINHQLVVKIELNPSTVHHSKQNQPNQPFWYSFLITNINQPSQSFNNPWNQSDLTPITANLQIDAKTLMIANFDPQSANTNPDVPLDQYDSITLWNHADKFDLNWWFNNRFQLFQGNLDLITSPSDFYFYNPSQAQPTQPLIEAASDGKSLKIYLGIKPFVHFENNQLATQTKVLAISIVNLKPITQPLPSTHFYQTTVLNSIRALNLGLFKQLDQYPVDFFNNQWLFTYRKALFQGTISLIKSPDAIINLVSEALGRTSIRIRFQLAPYTYINKYQQVGNQPLSMSFIIYDFPSDRLGQIILPTKPQPQPPGSKPPSTIKPPDLKPTPLQQAWSDFNEQLMRIQLKTNQLSAGQAQAINGDNALDLFASELKLVQPFKFSLIGFTSPQIDYQAQQINLNVQFRIFHESDPINFLTSYQRQFKLELV